MALTLPTTTRSAIPLAEFLEHVRGSLDVRDADSLAGLAEPLAALAHDRGFLARRLNEELASFHTFQAKNAAIPETLELARGEGWLLRLNVWVPLQGSPALNGRQSRVYQEAHDHNFSFLTVGYWGSGYGTTIHEYDPERVEGRPGERVELRFVERTTLPRGKVMLYRASRDVHSQEYPEELSVSLNLITFSPETESRNQYLFDLERGTLRGFVENQGAGRVLLCRLASHLGDGTTAALLEELCERHPAPRSRAEAYRARAALEPASAERLWEQALGDANPHVRAVARDALSSLKARR